MPKWIEQDAFSCFLKFIEIEKIDDIDMTLCHQLLWIADFFKVHKLIKILTKEIIQVKMNPSIVLEYFNDSHKKLSTKNSTDQLWHEIFIFCLDYISLHLDKLWENRATKEKIVNYIDSNPLIIEAIVEKSLKH